MSNLIDITALRYVVNQVLVQQKSHYEPNVLYKAIRRIITAWCFATRQASWRERRNSLRRLLSPDRGDAHQVLDDDSIWTNRNVKAIDSYLAMQTKPPHEVAAAIYQEFLEYHVYCVEQTDMVWVPLGEGAVLSLQQLNSLTDEEIIAFGNQLVSDAAHRIDPSQITVMKHQSWTSWLQRFRAIVGYEFSGIPLQVSSVLLLRWGGGRKKSGSFYTPYKLAYATVARTLEPLIHNKTAEQILQTKVCDPATGGGVFLLCALEYLTTMYQQVCHPSEARDVSYKRVVENCIYGVDLDEGALDIARWALLYRAPEAVSAVQKNLRHGNALIGAWVGNIQNHPILSTWTVETASKKQLDRWTAGFYRHSLSHSHVQKVMREELFFHWQLAFPEVFENGGFEAVIGNPPWESHKPDSREFFERYDPLFRLYRKQKAVDVQKRLCLNPNIEMAWKRQVDLYKDRSLFFRQASQGSAFGYPYCKQHSADANLYKLFIEQSFFLLRSGGQLGLIVPANLHTDRGATELRKMLLDNGQWRWLYGFWNPKLIFPIDPTYRFVVAIVKKGSQTKVIQSAFFVQDVEKWAEEHPSFLSIRAEEIRRMSPRYLLIPALDEEYDLTLINKMTRHSIPLYQLPGLQFRSGLHMTAAAKLLRPRTVWEDEGYKVNEKGFWVHSNGHVALPLYEGRMIAQFDYAAKAWVRGTGRRAEWRTLEWQSKSMSPQFLIAKEDAPAVLCQPRLGFMAVTRPTVKRTAVGALLDCFPSGNAVSNIYLQKPVEILALTAVFNSLAFDYIVKQRCTNLNLNWFLLAECPVPHRALQEPYMSQLATLAATLSLSGPHYGPLRRTLGYEQLGMALGPKERLQIRVQIDRLVFSLYGLEKIDIQWVLRDCQHPIASLKNRKFTSTLAARGFWRVDADRPPAERLTGRVLATGYAPDSG